MSDNKKILVVEDEIAMQKALVDKLARNGFRTVTADDGETGLKTALNEHPDLIIIDIIMPKIDGISMVKKLREDTKWGANVPVIMLTNLSDPDSVSEVAEYGVFDFLVKTDWKLDDVVALVKEKLGISE